MTTTLSGTATAFDQDTGVTEGNQYVYEVRISGARGEILISSEPAYASTASIENLAATPGNNQRKYCPGATSLPQRRHSGS